MKKLFFIFIFVFPLPNGEGWGGAAFSQKSGDKLFNSPIVHYVNISFPEPDYWNQLTKNYDSKTKKDTNIYILANIKIDSISLDSIGVRLKGNSSYNHPGLKKPIKLSFSQYDSTKTFDKLKQLNLNNGFLDPTMMREKVFLDFLHEKKLPAPRCTYAEVYFNGVYIGLYKMIEEIDKKFLKKHFDNNDGNLYKGDPSGTLEWKGEAQWDYYDAYAKKTNDSINDWSDLLQFIAQINHSPMESFKSNMDAVFNTSPFIRVWAANDLFVNLDSYFFLPHNYYLYHNPATGKFEWITWDVSVVFGVFPMIPVKQAEKTALLYNPVKRHQRMLTYNMLLTDDYRKEYLNAVCEFLYNDFTEEKLFPEIDSIANVIRPYIQKESRSNRMYSPNEFEKNINSGTKSHAFLDFFEIPGLKSFITARRNNVIEQLCELKWSCAKGESISDSLEQVVNIYPNPATKEITVDIKIIEPESKTINYKIVNMLGETVFSDSGEATGNSYTQNISTLNFISGIYVLSAVSGCESYNKKIVIIK